MKVNRSDLSRPGIDFDQLGGDDGRDPAGDELVRILSQLTLDVERFDSMIRNQRHLLTQQLADPDAIDDRLIRCQSRRINANAAEIATRARHALAELRGMSNVVHFRPVDREQQDDGERAEGQPTA